MMERRRKPETTMAVAVTVSGFRSPNANITLDERLLTIKKESRILNTER
jgi:uncharacterized protein YcbK (DUF882 family)